MQQMWRAQDRTGLQHQNMQIKTTDCGSRSHMISSPPWQPGMFIYEHMQTSRSPGKTLDSILHKTGELV